jgi:hypothetical protein
LIEDPEGLGFVIVAGAVIGAEGGKVTRIDPGRIVVEPTTGARIVLRVSRDDAGTSDP